MTDEYLTEGTAEYVMSLFPKDFTGVCVDVGAYDPFWISNSWIFEQAGWDTYCIEPNPHCIPRLKKYRKNVLEYACGHKNKDDINLFIYLDNFAGPNLENTIYWNGEASGTGLIDLVQYCNPLYPSKYKKIYSEVVKIKVRTLDWLMENEIKHDHIDFLSIDVERNELSVLVGTNLFKWKPKVIAIERQAKDPDLVIDTIWQSTEEQDILLRSKGYRCIYRVEPNDIYMQQDYYYEHMFRDV